MRSFRDLPRHFGALPPETVNSLVWIAERAGRQALYADQHPTELEALRQIALIQSAESSNAIENIHVPRKRLEALMAEQTQPANRSEQEVAGYRLVLDTVHSNALDMPFEVATVLQLHGYMARFTGDRTAGRLHLIDNNVEEIHPDGTKTVRFEAVSGAETLGAMDELHERFNAARGDATFNELLLDAAYVLDFLVIHPFRDGNGRMSRLITLWLLYMGGNNLGRYVSLEKIIEDSKETYYEALAASTVGWHISEHDLAPWVSYFLGILIAAYKEFEDRAGTFGGPGSKRELVVRFIETNISNEFTLADIRRSSPQASDSHLRRILAELKADGKIKPMGRGRSAKWQRLAP